MAVNAEYSCGLGTTEKADRAGFDLGTILGMRPWSEHGRDCLPTIASIIQLMPRHGDRRGARQRLVGSHHRASRVRTVCPAHELPGLLDRWAVFRCQVRVSDTLLAKPEPIDDASSPSLTTSPWESQSTTSRPRAPTASSSSSRRWARPTTSRSTSAIRRGRLSRRSPRPCRSARCVFLGPPPRLSFAPSLPSSSAPSLWASRLQRLSLG